MNKFDYTVEFGDMHYAWEGWAEDYDSAYEIETIIKFNDDRPDIKFTMRAGFDFSNYHDCVEDAFFSNAMEHKTYYVLAEDCWKFEYHNWVSSVYDDVMSIFDWGFLDLSFDMLMRKKLKKTISLEVPDNVRNTYLVYKYYKGEIEHMEQTVEILDHIMKGMIK